MLCCRLLQTSRSSRSRTESSYLFTMLRHVITGGFAVLCKSSYYLKPRRHVSCFLPVNSMRLHQGSIPFRCLSTGGPVLNDPPKIKGNKSEETETLDLEGWKSIMKSQATFKEQDFSDKVEVSNNGENLEDAGGILQGSSSLEATRLLVSMWRQAGKLVPQEMTEEEVRAVAELTTKSSRRKYLKYLAIRERSKLTQKEKQQQKKAEREALMKERALDGNAEEEDGHKMKNALFLQFWSSSLDKLLAWRSAQTMVFGQPLVFDMSYDSHMSKREIENTVSQLMELEGYNRRATEPFHLHFCNLQPDGSYKKELLKRYGAEPWDRLFITSTEHQHVDLFPREQLVYLTADSPNVLHNFDHSKVYIIGALVDRSTQSGLSMARAKRLKLATARLPLDEHLNWGMGGKNLTLDQMMRIMLAVKDTGKWAEALKFVPKRKYDGFHQEKAQSEVRNNTARGLARYRSRENADGLVKSAARDAGRTLSFHRSDRKPIFSGRDKLAGLSEKARESTSSSNVRKSFKSDMEDGKTARKHKIWWHDD